jgi:amino acid transporter/nucleotide-binding universal stress UspA family protein
MNPENTGSVSLARTLGLGSIVLLGIGALLGGGIFTLLGPAAGLAGPGLFMSMILGAGIAFLNLQMYIALGTTFPETGGGYLWVKMGLGNFQGFLAGWISWFAHAVAAGVYALSFGFYVHELLRVVGIELPISAGNEAKILGIFVVAIFGYQNWKGIKSAGKAGNYITGALMGILGLFIIAGGIRMASEPTETIQNLTPLLPYGWLGILAAASFFYIAFEGSEIQVQAAEETKDPQNNIKKGLISSWAIVSALYILIALIFTATMNWQLSSALGEGAIVTVAEKFLPLGKYLMIIGGLFANLAALNATIYSSSRVSFALARDKNILSHLALIHTKNLTPHIAVIVSTLLIGGLIAIFPLFDIASAASLLFVLLFLQLNIAGINIHYKWPNTKWFYKIPLFPATPLLASALYLLLALTMFGVNLNAWIMTAFWVLLGLVNYFAYVEPKSRARFENKIVYEGSVRIGPKNGKRILLPLSPQLKDEEIKNLAEFSFALASQFDGEVVAVRVHEIPPVFGLDPSVFSSSELDRERAAFGELQKLADDFNRKTGPQVKDINFHGLILIGRDATDVLLDVVQMEECDVLLLHWGGTTSEKGVRFGTVIDRLLREAKCDTVVIKNPKAIKSLMLATDLGGKSPYLAFLGEIVSAVKKYYQAKTYLFSVLPKATPAYLKPDFSTVIKGLGLKRKDFDIVSSYNSNSTVRAVMYEAEKEKVDLLLIGASRPRFLREIRFGATSELFGKHYDGGLAIAKGHESPTELLWTKLINLLKNKKTPSKNEVL